jgi:hypothetical protein
MTELEFYKWLKEYDPEWRWDKNSQSKQDDVIIWVSIYALESFFKLLPKTVFDDGGIEARLQDKCVVIWASDICDHCGIELEKMFEKITI